MYLSNLHSIYYFLLSLFYLSISFRDGGINQLYCYPISIQVINSMKYASLHQQTELKNNNSKQVGEEYEEFDQRSTHLYRDHCSEQIFLGQIISLSHWHHITKMASNVLLLSGFIEVFRKLPWYQAICWLKNNQGICSSSVVKLCLHSLFRSPLS